MARAGIFARSSVPTSRLKYSCRTCIRTRLEPVLRPRAQSTFGTGIYATKTTRNVFDPSHFPPSLGKIGMDIMKKTRDLSLLRVFGGGYTFEISELQHIYLLGKYFNLQ